MLATGRTILLVEDDDDIRVGLTDALEGAGYQVLAARNGEEALAILRAPSASPSVVLLDMMMPIMDGAAFLAARARDPRLLAFPVLLMTAGRTRVDPAWQVTAALAKPMRLAALLSAIDEIAPRGSG